MSRTKTGKIGYGCGHPWPRLSSSSDGDGYDEASRACPLVMVTAVNGGGTSTQGWAGWRWLDDEIWLSLIRGSHWIQREKCRQERQLDPGIEDWNGDWQSIAQSPGSWHQMLPNANFGNYWRRGNEGWPKGKSGQAKMPNLEGAQIWWMTPRRIWVIPSAGMTRISRFDLLRICRTNFNQIYFPRKICVDEKLAGVYFRSFWWRDERNRRKEGMNENAYWGELQNWLVLGVVIFWLEGRGKGWME